MEARLVRAENLITKYRGEAAKRRQAVLIEELKPVLLEKIKNNDGEAVQEFEELVITAERSVLPFARGCKAPPSEFNALADKATASVDLAKAAADTARGAVCPIDDLVDEGLDDEVKKELLKFIKPEIKKTQFRIGFSERRLRRCSQLIKSFRADILKKLGQRAEKVRVLVVRLLRELRQKDDLSVEQLFSRFSPVDGFIDEAAFQRFLKDAGADDEMPPEDRSAVFRSCLKEGQSQLNLEDLNRLVSTFMKVVSATSLMDGLSISSSKALKTLKVGQVLEVLEGPKADDSSGLSRVRVKLIADGVEGWATTAGNAGTIFLKECDAPIAKEKA